MVREKPRQIRTDRPFRTGEARSVRRRFGHVTQSDPMREIIDVAMVGLIGGGPRLAIRAARVLLEDSYASRASARRTRVHDGAESSDT